MKTTPRHASNFNHRKTLSWWLDASQRVPTRDGSPAVQIAPIGDSPFTTFSAPGRLQGTTAFSKATETVFQLWNTETCWYR